MEDKLCFVQFLHPGGEHRPDSNGVKPWNNRSHKRKFLTINGSYVTAGNELRSGKIQFWGEWEPPSRATLLSSTSDELLNGYPEYLHEPYREHQENYLGLQNTDPFVFGEHFHYTGCQQNTKLRPTQLRYLALGSVILFGSFRHDEFVLDTVFVVAKCLDHHAGNFTKVLRSVVSPEYWDVTIRPWYLEWEEQPVCGRHPAPNETYRLYTGASYDDPYEKMFSFFPCKPNGSSTGFPRPSIRLTEVVNGAIKQGKKLNPQKSVSDVYTLWKEVVKQVYQEGLVLGVHASLPFLKPDSGIFTDTK